MYCWHCGKEIGPNDKFCVACGAKQTSRFDERAEKQAYKEAKRKEKEARRAEKQAIKEEKAKQPKKIWTIFGKLSRILSIVAMATFWIPTLGANVGVVAIVFSILGRKSEDSEVVAERKKTLTRAIVATCLGITITFAFMFITYVVSFVKYIIYAMGNINTFIGNFSKIQDFLGGN